MPPEVLKLIRQQKEGLSDLRRQLKALTTKQVSRVGPRTLAHQLGTRWFSDVEANLRASSRIPAETIGKYSDWFKRLVKLSRPNNSARSYLEVVSELLKSYENELLLPLQTSTGGPVALTQLAAILNDIPDSEQSAYLQEAAACAVAGHLRASAVLGWCAAIDHIHRAVELAGFTKFNVRSSWMASQTTGRFKKFNHPQNVNSISELREVFDTIVLWVVEGMEMIDSNEHTRLSGCFDLRCQCAHPGNAPVTPYNLMSYFSDLKEIVFANQRLPK
jgi:hypothetical protein